MPVTVGTRLERLRALRAQIDAEIKVEERAQHAALGGRLRRPLGKARTTARTSVQDMLDAHGVTSLDVKRWAYEVGLIAEIQRGRIARELVEAYIKAHVVLDAVEQASARFRELNGGTA